MTKSSVRIPPYRKSGERLPFISMAIVLGGLILIAVILFTTWWVFMPSDDRQPHTAVQLTAAQADLAARLEEDVLHLAETIGERNMHLPGTMDTASLWIEHRMKEIGFDPARHTYKLQRGFYRDRTADNLVAEVRGTVHPDQTVIIGAHYDTVPGSPGANDNSSAVAALLALATFFYENPQPQTVRFVSFANEEPPFFQTKDMGSYAYARELKNRNEKISAMFSMDGLGYYSDKPGSQRYPFPGIGLIYPDKADFIGFVTRFGDTGLMKRALNAFRRDAVIPAEGVALPGIIPGVSWSDHWSFWKHDFPAFLVTDTLLFRDPNYHLPQDTPDKLDFKRMALVVDGLKGVIGRLASSS